MYEIRLTPQTKKELARVSRRLRSAGAPKEIKKDLTKGIRSAVKPIERRVKAAALSLPSRGPSRNRLRQNMARATSIQVRTSGRNAGVKIGVAKRRLPEAQQNMPKLTNTGRWRHPVFGGDVWVSQSSRAEWFDSENRRGAPLVRKGIKKVISQIEKKVSR